MCQPDTGKFHSSYIGMNVCGSAYENKVEYVKDIKSHGNT